MFSLTNHIDSKKLDVSVIGMKSIMKELNISYSTLYRWITNKDMPHYKVKGSKKLLFNRNKIEEWLEGQTGIPQKHTRLP